MNNLDLTKKAWRIQGWKPFTWLLKTADETNLPFYPVYGPVPAAIPGSVHTALRREGLIADWNIGMNSLNCEWIEHRHWEFFTEFKAGEISSGNRIVLEADGLDYSGWILVDNEPAAVFSGALKRHAFDLTDLLSDGKAHRLRIVFDLPPEEQGQIGFTSRSKFLKPRYNFSWDWCVRLVPVGIWDSLRLRIGSQKSVLVNYFTQTAGDTKSGEIILRLRNDTNEPLPVCVTLADPSGGAARHYQQDLQPGFHELRFAVENPKLWWPNGEGAQPLYELSVSVGEEQIVFGKIGFKHILWIASKDAKSDVRPLLCEVNGVPIFIQGVNWTPVNLDYHDVDEARYRERIALYKEMGVNILRVWGGAFLEREIFYQLCDEFGLMVWQEFPLSSSGCDSCPPEHPDFIKDLTDIARDYVRRRSGHVSLFVWCGGNELQTQKDRNGMSFPLSEAHPAMDALRNTVQNESPGVRFFPTSPSGPVFAVEERNIGKGLHHHVHAPWDCASTEEEWTAYWDRDDAIFRAECGVAGMSSLSLIKKYSGGYAVWPATFENSLWRHSSSFWLQEQLAKSVDETNDPDGATTEVIRRSQQRQADFLSYAVRRCKERFPVCTGFVVWMGHDCFPMLVNSSLIDYDGTPKPAFYALKKIFRQKCVFHEKDRTKKNRQSMKIKEGLC